MLNGMNNNADCRDYTGKSIQHGMHFVPPGIDMCKLCICDNGQPKVKGQAPIKLSILISNFFIQFRVAVLSYVPHHQIVSLSKWVHPVVNLYVLIQLRLPLLYPHTFNMSIVPD